MKYGKRFLVIILVILLISVLYAVKEEKPEPSEKVLNTYLQYSPYTDPGPFEYVYDNTPDSIEEICDLIKKQLIHPFDIEKFGDTIPKNRAFGDRSIPTVEGMLRELLLRDNRGLESSRKPQNRLVVACVHHSLLLASLLRHKGIPVRIRAGNAKYIGDDKRVRITHVICEVWNAHNNEWFLVDPDRNKIDFDRQEFEFACETWQKLRDERIERKYYFSRYKSVDQAAAHLVWLDLNYLVKAEEPYWNDPPLVLKIKNSINDISAGELHLLDRTARLLEDPDHNLDDLVEIVKNNTGMH